MDLRGKTALVTGSSSGIGAAIAKEFAARGANVVLLARRAERLEALTSSIVKSGGTACYFAVDLTDTTSTIDICASIRSQVGVPDVIVNNAGMGKFRFIEETCPSEMIKMMAVPYFAAFTVTHAFMNDMLNRRAGHIVNVTSPAAFFPFPGATAYAAARWAMRGFSEALKMDLYGTGVKCSLVTFGEVMSDYFVKNPGSYERIPGVSKLFPRLTPEQCGTITANMVESGAGNVCRPKLLSFSLWLARFFPGVLRWAINRTGYKRLD